MTYEKTPIKNNIKAASRRECIKHAEELSTPLILWMLVKRHKQALLVTYAGYATALYFFPALPDVLRALF